MWLKFGFALVLVTAAPGTSGQTVGEIFGDVMNAMKSGQTSFLESLIPGVRPMSFIWVTMVKAMAFRQENQTISGVIKQQFEGLMRDTVLTNVSEPCFNAFLFSLSSVTGVLTGSFPVDVAHMFDASGKSVSGTMRGSILRKGNYHQCIKVNISQALTESIEGLEHGFVGKFCRVDALYGNEPTSSDPERKSSVLADEEEAYCERFPEPHGGGGGESGTRSSLTDNACLVRQDYGDEQIYRQRAEKPFQIALCVPSVCTIEDVHGLFNRVCQIHKKDIRIRDVQCRQKDQNTLSTWSVCALGICSLLGLTTLSATIYHIWLGFQTPEDLPPEDKRRKNSPKPYRPGHLGNILLCFSVQRNLGFILNHQPESTEDVLPSVNGLRSLTLLWVMGTNLLFIAKDRPWVNYIGLLENLRTMPMQIFINGRFAADTSFCLGGFLAAYFMLKRMSEPGGKIGVWQHYLHRYLRLAPALLLMIVVTSGVYAHSADGPDWIDERQYEDVCLKHWWKGLLFVNNFFNGSDSCPPVSWYLATDMQLHMMAPLIVYPLHSYPGFGLSLLGLLLATFATIPALITASGNLPYFMGRLFYLDKNHANYTFHILMKPWSHASPFLVGIFVGYLLHRNGRKALLSTAIVTSGWLAAIMVKIIIIFGFYPYVDGTSRMSTIGGILYTTLTPTLWAAATAWIIFACLTNNGGIASYFLSWGAHDVITRVSYCAYLINSLAILHFLQSRADSFYYDTCNLMMVFAGSVFTTLVSAILLSAAIERPVRELEKLWLEKGFQSNGLKTIDDGHESEEDEKNSGATPSETVDVFRRVGTWMKSHGAAEGKIPLPSDM